MFRAMTPLPAAAVTLAAGLLLTSPALAGTWSPRALDGLGVTLLAPRGAAFKKQTWDAGWRGVRASADGVELTVASLPNKKVTAGMMREQAEALTGLGREHWTVEKTYKGKQGWFWYCTARAAGGDRAVVAVYGISDARSTYVLLIATDKKVARQRRGLLARWHRSIKVRAPRDDSQESARTGPGAE